MEDLGQDRMLRHDPASAAASRSDRFLGAPIIPMLARVSLPNVAVVTAMTLVTVADAWFVGRLGSAALASLALVFPVQALMQMMSAGAMGGGVSSAVARALGAGRPERADAIVLHAAIIALGMAALYALVAGLGARALFDLLGGEGEVLTGAVAYARIAFGGALAMWLANTFASVIRGTGNMTVPALTLIGTSLVQIPLSGALTVGWGPAPALGIRGPAVAMVLAFALATLVMASYVLAGRGGIHLRPTARALRPHLFADILKVGAVACGNALLTIATILIVTRLVASHGVSALAGYGLGSRLELILVPMSFGVGASLTAAVGTNFGASQFARARRIAWTGGLLVAALTGAVGLVAAVSPALWLSLFTADPEAYAMGVRYLRIVGPFYGFFGLGMALYFASQGTGNMVWPFVAGTARVVVVAGGGLVAVLLFGAGSSTLFVLVACGLVCFGLIVAWSLLRPAWNPV
jgi:putative MATE family efflux protein